MYTKQVDAYNKTTRRFAVRTDAGVVCYVIEDRAGSEIMKGVAPQGVAATMEEARRWVDGEPVLLMSAVIDGPMIDC